MKGTDTASNLTSRKLQGPKPFTAAWQDCPNPSCPIPYHTPSSRKRSLVLLPLDMISFLTLEILGATSSALALQYSCQHMLLVRNTTGPLLQSQVKHRAVWFLAECDDGNQTGTSPRPQKPPSYLLLPSLQDKATSFILCSN